MRFAEIFKKKLKEIPKPGMRIYKTALCVLICLMLNYLFGRQLTLISSWAAIMCVQSTLENSLKTGVSRFLGTALGGVFAMLLLPIAQNTKIEWLYIILMPVGIILVIYLCVLFKMPGSASMGAFVYIAILFIPFNPISNANPYIYAIDRILDTMVGVTIALLINRFVSPPRAQEKNSVLINANTYPSIYDKVKNNIKDDVRLILFASELALDKKHKSIIESAENFGEIQNLDLCVPVPLEFQNEPLIHGIYIDLNYKTIDFKLNQQAGYVEIPSIFYPATLIWHTEEIQAKFNSYRKLIMGGKTELPLKLARNKLNNYRSYNKTPHSLDK